MKAYKMRFDTHLYVKKAEAAGFTLQQAEFQAGEMFTLLGEAIDNKLDQLVTHEEFNNKMNSFRDELIGNFVTKNEFKSATQSLHNEIQSLHTETQFLHTETQFLRRETESLHHEIKLIHKDMQILDTKIGAIDSKLTWLISLFGLVSILLSAVSLLHGFHIM